MVVGCQRHALAALTPCKKHGAHLSGSWVEKNLFWTCEVMKISFASTGSRIPVRPSHSLLSKTYGYVSFKITL